MIRFSSSGLIAWGLPCGRLDRGRKAASPLGLPDPAACRRCERSEHPGTDHRPSPMTTASPSLTRRASVPPAAVIRHRLHTDPGRVSG